MGHIQQNTIQIPLVLRGKRVAPRTVKLRSPISYQGLSVGDNPINTKASGLKNNATLKFFLMDRALCEIP